MPKLRPVAIALIAGCALFDAPPGYSQVPPQGLSNPKAVESDKTIPEKIAPPEPSQKNSGDQDSLSTKLTKSNGTIVPSGDVDTGIVKKPVDPNPDGMVVPAPGSPGGRQDLIPK